MRNDLVLTGVLLTAGGVAVLVAASLPSLYPVWTARGIHAVTAISRNRGSWQLANLLFAAGAILALAGLGTLVGPARPSPRQRPAAGRGIGADDPRFDPLAGKPGIPPDRNGTDRRRSTRRPSRARLVRAGQRLGGRAVVRGRGVRSARADRLRRCPWQGTPCCRPGLVGSLWRSGDSCSPCLPRPATSHRSSCTWHLWYSASPP